MMKSRLLTALLALSLVAPSSMVVAMDAAGGGGTAMVAAPASDEGAVITSITFEDGSHVNASTASSSEKGPFTQDLSTDQEELSTAMDIDNEEESEEERVVLHLESEFLKNENWQHVLYSFGVQSIFTLGDLQDDIRARKTTDKITALELLTESDTEILQQKGDTLLIHPVLLYERIRHCLHPQLTPVPSAGVVQTGLRLSILLLALTMADLDFMLKTLTLPLTPNLYLTLKGRLAELARPHITPTNDATFRQELANVANLFNKKTTIDYAFPSWVLNESLSFRGSNGLIFKNPDLQELQSCFYDPRGEQLMEIRGDVITRALKKFGRSKSFHEFFRQADDLEALVGAAQEE